MLSDGLGGSNAVGIPAQFHCFHLIERVLAFGLLGSWEVGGESRDILEVLGSVEFLLSGY